MGRLALTQTRMVLCLGGLWVYHVTRGWNSALVYCLIKAFENRDQSSRRFIVGRLASSKVCLCVWNFVHIGCDLQLHGCFAVPLPSIVKRGQAFSFSCPRLRSCTFIMRLEIVLFVNFFACLCQAGKFSSSVSSVTLPKVERNSKRFTESERQFHGQWPLYETLHSSSSSIGPPFSVLAI